MVLLLPSLYRPNLAITVEGTLLKKFTTLISKTGVL